ncbi:MAG TPA: hypothetical protein VL484_15595 [Vicinamibacterales bacterium]|jgi:hypothetical protein|nr:hypothetical protein [Vicinamibacterales bacterium]
MTRAVWVWSTGTAVALFAAWMASSAISSPTHLRSLHSEPASSAPAVVVVTAEGKLFHRAGCTYVHGPARAESGSQAIADGYTPCAHCLPRTTSH